MAKTMADGKDALDLLGDLIARARRAGADEADAVLFEGASLSHAQRLGRTEKLERSESYDLGLRVLVGKRQAIVSSNDRAAERLAELVERALAMAKAVPEDPYCGLADASEIARSWAELDLVDATEPSPEILIARAAAAEEAARAVPGVTNSEGAEASWGRSRVAMAASNGFAGSYASTGHSVSVAVLAGEGTGMERDYAYSSMIHAGDLRDPVAVGKEAGERAVRRLGGRKAATATVPVVYDPRVSSGLLRPSRRRDQRSRGRARHQLSEGQARRAPLSARHLHHRRPAQASRAALEAVRRRGHRQSAPRHHRGWSADHLAARPRLGAPAASRDDGPRVARHLIPPSPSPTNLWLEPAPVTARELIGDIASGLYITELMGMGVNGVTGDYSRGAAGFWIENGALTYPVSEVTVAGNLKDMFQHLSAASDLEFKTGIDAPTLRIDGMTVAGR